MFHQPGTKLLILSPDKAILSIDKIYSYQGNIMMIKKNQALISVILFAISFGLMAEPVRHVAKDGMTLKLGNYTQQIKVRAKALGASNCNVEFSIKGKTVVVVAPVNDYSDWIGVGPTFLAPSNEKLGVSVKCDDGAIAQVTYHQ